MREPVSPPTLPITWRPVRGRIVAYGFAAVVVVGAVLMTVFLADSFMLPDKILMISFGLGIAAVLHLLGRVRVTADERGLTVVNAIKTHRYDWAQVFDVTLIEGEPWAKIDFSDGRTVGAMGIQGSEKARARQATAELEALIHARGEAPTR